MSILHWSCEACKKGRIESAAKCMSDFNYNKKHAFDIFYNAYNEFKEMSLDSKHNRMKEFNKRLIGFKAVKTKKKRNTT